MDEKIEVAATGQATIINLSERYERYSRGPSGEYDWNIVLCKDCSTRAHGMLIPVTEISAHDEYHDLCDTAERLERPFVNDLPGVDPDEPIPYEPTA